MLNIISLLEFILKCTILFDLCVLIFVLLNKGGEKSARNQFIVLMVFLLEYEILLWQGFFTPMNQEMGFLNDSLMFICGGLLLLSALNFAWTFTERREIHKNIITTFAVISCLFAVMIPIPGAIIGNRAYTAATTYNYTVTPGLLYIPYHIFFLLTSALMVYIFVKANKHTSPIRKREIRTVTIGVLIALMLGITTLLLLPLTAVFFNAEIWFNSATNTIIGNVIATIGMSFFSSFSAYAIVRHRMLDITVKLKRSTLAWFVYSITAISISLLAIIFHYFLQPPLQWTIALSVLLGLFIAQPLKTFSEKLTLSITKKRLLALYELTPQERGLLEQTQNPQKTGSLFAADLQQHLPTKDLVIYIYDHFAGWHELAFGKSKTNGISVDDPLIGLFSQTPNHIHAIDVLEQRNDMEEKTKRMLSKLQADYIVPLYNEQTSMVIGLILFSVHFDGKPLSDIDRAWLLKQQQRWQHLLWVCLQRYYFVQDHIDKGTVRAQREE